MISKKMLLALAIPMTFSSAFAALQVIPKAQQIIAQANANESQFVLKNTKGTLLQKSLMDAAPSNWFNLSPIDGAEGMRTEETYVAFGLPISDDIIVAVIDSGVDVNHEDLQGKIWTNAGEIANDGVDNDGNGYIDDVFGWNFIGGKDGMAKIVDDVSVKNGKRLIKGKPEAQIGNDTLEVTRELVRMKKLKASVESLGEELTAPQAEYYEALKKDVDENVANATQVVASYTARQELYKKSEAILKAAGVSAISIESVQAVSSTDAAVVQAKADMLKLLTNGLTEARITRVLDAYTAQLDFNYNVSFNPRPIVGDEYSDITVKTYGNNDVIGPDSHHGTHVSGSIAATRDNNIGIKGVATNVKIMAVRVVPNGDERDKDVANGIRYAVDNGAKIINMSFGKAFSPNKKYVDEAVRYAQSKGVLLVHAAGNSNQNNDTTPNFPNRKDLAAKSEFSNWLEIGASGFEKGLNLPADFSNYGKKSVDLFAPGVDILSTTPDNKYDTYSGTSMACPSTAGALALALSYNPSLNAEELRALILDTSRRYPKLQVNLPGTETPVLFSTLSLSGTIVDVFEAVKAAR
jgi:cell wall-associated protease